MKQFVVCVFCICAINCYGRSVKINPFKDYFRQSATLGTSFSYTWSSDNYFGEHFYQEYSWNINTSMRLTKRFWLGGHFNPIFTFQKINIDRNQANYYFGGIFLRYDLIQLDQFAFFIESSFNSTNYCTCGDYTDPFLEKSLYTWGIGGGMKFLLNPAKQQNLWLELAVKNYTLFDSYEDDYPLDQYLIGINFQLGRQN